MSNDPLLGGIFFGNCGDCGQTAEYCICAPDDENRDYLAEAWRIVRGETLMMATDKHLKAMAEYATGLERELAFEEGADSCR